MRFTSDNQPARKGRPKGSKNLTSMLRALLNEKTEVTTKSGKVIKRTRSLQILDAMIDRATKGDTKAAQLIIERLEGLPKAEIDQRNAHVVHVIRSGDAAAPAQIVDTVEPDALPDDTRYPIAEGQGGQSGEAGDV